MVVHKINSGARDLSANGPIVEHVKELLDGFKEARVKWVRQSANKVAHMFARECCFNKICKSWFQVLHEFTNSAVASEGMSYESITILLPYVQT